MANTVPLAEVPPIAVVPYKVLPDDFSSACGLAPSLLVPSSSAVKACKTVNACAEARPLGSKTKPANTTGRRGAQLVGIFIRQIGLCWSLIGICFLRAARTQGCAAEGGLVFWAQRTWDDIIKTCGRTSTGKFCPVFLVWQGLGGRVVVWRAPRDDRCRRKPQVPGRSLRRAPAGRASVL